jgi:Na+/serine symporter
VLWRKSIITGGTAIDPTMAMATADITIDRIMAMRTVGITIDRIMGMAIAVRIMVMGTVGTTGVGGSN